MIKCPNCTGEMNYEAVEGLVKCPYCGSIFNPKELKTEVKMATERPINNNGIYQGKSYNCTQCGATLLTFDETAITFCSYCGSQAMIESKMIQQNNPDFLIPFEKSKEECFANYKKLVNKSLYAPNYLKTDITFEKFRGIYIPYAIYKIGYNGPVKNEGLKYSHRSGDYEIYNKYAVNYDVNSTYEGLSYDLLSKFYDKFSTAIPYDYHKKVPFNPNYLIGYYADTMDVDKDIYLPEAINMARNDFTSKAKKYREFKLYGVNYPTAPLKSIETKTGMFPVYFLALRNKKNTRINYAVVNGQSGEVVAELPVDFKKYLIVSTLLAIIIFIFIDLYLVLTPREVSIVGIVLGIIGLVISKIQYDQLKRRENHLDDLGVSSTKTNQLPGKIKFKNKKLLIAIVLPIIALLLNLVSDLYYYGAALISFLLTIISFYEIINEHNELVSNKIPQLEARGGDENA